MPRTLSSGQCELTFYDKLSGSNITLFYRIPTAEEQIKYINSQVTRNGRKIESTMGENRLDGGLKILLGFKEGAFENEKGKLISSDPQSANYNEKWKDLVSTFAPDVIARLAMVVFEGSLEVQEKEDPT